MQSNTNPMNPVPPIIVDPSRIHQFSVTQPVPPIIAKPYRIPQFMLHSHRRLRTNYLQEPLKKNKTNKKKTDFTGYGPYANYENLNLQIKTDTVSTVQYSKVQLGCSQLQGLLAPHLTSLWGKACWNNCSPQRQPLR